MLERARLAVPKNAEIWTESIRLERRAKNLPAANNLMAQALQQIPKSGLLWTERPDASRGPLAPQVARPRGDQAGRKRQDPVCRRG